MVDTAQTPPGCPTCQAELAPGAVFCVNCGFDLRTGIQHAAAVAEDEQGEPLVDGGGERHQPSENPYAVSRAPNRSNSSGESELSNQALRSVRAVVNDATLVVPIILIVALMCRPLGIVILPWYTIRLIRWHHLCDQFRELKIPNSFSEHGQLADRFQRSRNYLIAGVVCGLLFWVWLLGGLVVMLSEGRI